MQNGTVCVQNQAFKMQHARRLKLKLILKHFLCNKPDTESNTSWLFFCYIRLAMPVRIRGWIYTGCVNESQGAEK